MKTSELYKRVTGQVIAMLKDGVPPWTQPWKDSRLKGLGMTPSNLITGRLYSGSNILLLWMTAQERGYDSLQFCTYNQVNGVGASVKKGEKSTHIIFTKHVTKKDEESGEEKPSTIVKTYPVFHVSQLEKVPEKYLGEQVSDDKTPTRELAVAFLRGTGLSVSHGGNKAAYYPTRDEIVMPTVGAFENEDSYWGTMFHEATHATGHEKRLARKFGKRFGDREYAAEELVAELGSAFLCARIGIEPTFRSASYIDNWLRILEGDTRAIFSASSYAGHSSDWLWKEAFGEEERQDFKEAAE